MLCSGSDCGAYCTAGISSADSLVFCSERCLHKHIVGLPPLSKEALGMFGISNSFCNNMPKECYSVSLGVGFRSWFECRLAEFIVAKWKTQVFYEAHMLPIDSTHFYVPDFWLPMHGVWLEVKGEWRFGGRKKFVTAQRILGADRLLLIPPAYKKWFSVKAWR